MSEFVEIVEVGPRDGLQNEPQNIETEQKIALVDCLSRVGFRRIEAASFVAPRWVPQMAGSAEVMAGITRREGTRYCALVPNMKGLEAAIAAGVDEVAVFASASEGFSRANLNATISESLERFRPVLEAAPMPVRGYVSCVVECPYDGAVPPASVAAVSEALFAMGCFQISLGDTIGRGRPEAVARMLDAVLQIAPPEHLAGHFHDTSGRALDNVDVSLERGIRCFDASVAGLGGCPYAPGAAGNVATEAVARHLEHRGYAHGLDLAALAEASEFAKGLRHVSDIAT